MRISSLAKAAMASIAFAPAALAGVVFTEDWQGVTGPFPVAITVPVTPTTGSFSSGVHSYTTFGSAASPPTLQIADFSGDLRLNNSAASTTAESHRVTSMTTTDSDKVITIEFDAHDPTSAGTSNQRFYVLVQNATTKDGYRVRLSTENNDEEVLNATLYNGGAEVADAKFDDEVEGAGVFGTPDVAGSWHVKMSFIKSGTDVVIAYEVTGLGATPNLVAANTFTFDEATFPGVNDIRDDFDQVDIWTRRPLGSMDNIVVTADTEGPAITLNGNATVTIDCGDAYTELGATALDNFDGDVTGDIVVTGDTVNPAVPGDYEITYNVSDQSGNAATEVIRTVTVANNCPPIIITPTSATSASVEEGEGPVTFGFTAAGTGSLTYLWYFDNGSKAPIALPTETTDTLVIPAPIALSQSGQYYAEVTDDFDTVASPFFTLTVTEQMPVSGISGLIVGALATAAAGLAGLRRKQ